MQSTAIGGLGRRHWIASIMLMDAENKYGYSAVKESRNKFSSLINPGISTPRNSSMLAMKPRILDTIKHGTSQSIPSRIARNDRVTASSLYGLNSDNNGLLIFDFITFTYKSPGSLLAKKVRKNINANKINLICA